MNTPQIQTCIDIKAPANVVWRLLTDMEGYRHWNPFVVNASGSVALGNQLLCQPQMPGGRRYTFRPRVTRLALEREFAWSDYVIHPRIGCGEHIFQLEPIGADGVRLFHNEVFTGMFAPLAVLFAGKQTRRGFELMNEALKQEAEKRAAA